jgi:tRNA-specific 2-thiouridylase
VLILQLLQHILKQQGHNVRGLFMKNWEADDDDEYCSSKQDLIDASQLLRKLVLTLKLLILQKNIKKRYLTFYRWFKKGLYSKP